MYKFLQAVSLMMLILTVLFPFLYLFDVVGESTMKVGVLAVTIVWFIVTPLWMGREDRAAAFTEVRGGANKE
ncbi:hypothetical protein SAMN05192555_11029 [Franzmannia pantelleriensis]|uniref:Uncharacterized protein n=1 Tax=Franzmannia pantelleriensis TaxID=48727 RepID=A0A1G9R126_9GAMM|nr:hypothetical protein [Halomonas pantelleriensis]SDM16986.1 hypothetical protein SAMN05192555_11029 [Halomonas pantelleriensis]